MVGVKRQAKKKRATATYAKAADLRDTVEKGGKSKGTVVDYAGCLRRADNWLPGQLESLRRDRDIVAQEMAKEHAVLNAPLDVPELPDNAAECFCIPMKCTPYLISMFLISECVTSAEPKGESVLKSIRAAFIWRFELLSVDPIPFSHTNHFFIQLSCSDLAVIRAAIITISSGLMTGLFPKPMSHEVVLSSLPLLNKHVRPLKISLLAAKFPKSMHKL